VGVLTAVVGDGEVLVDNDVHWAARAERASGCAVGVDDFVHLHLGEGLGCAVVSDGEVRRGHRGVAGEIAHVVTAGPSGAAMPLTRVFAELGLRRSGSTAIDVDALAAADDRTTAALADAVSGVCLAAIAFGDPQLLVLGGPWGRRPAFVELIRERARGWPRRVSVEASTLEGAPELLGARLRAVELLRSAVVEDSGRARRTAP
jgi:predicted NBD/HSP70 family sugar kinase